MRQTRYLGLFLGGLAGAGCLAATITAAAADAATLPGTPPAPAARPYARPGLGNPAGHAYVPPAGRAVNTSRPSHVVGRGTPASCTSAAVVSAVAEGGIITFNCGPKPVTITMTATARS